VTLVAITGWGQEEDKRRARESGFDQHLTKPVDVAALERILAEMR
jgi:CheY-like chemotaxis protein